MYIAAARLFAVYSVNERDREDSIMHTVVAYDDQHAARLAAARPDAAGFVLDRIVRVESGAIYEQARVL